MATRAKYKAWKRRKIIKHIIRFNILLFVLLSGLILSLRACETDSVIHPDYEINSEEITFILLNGMQDELEIRLHELIDQTAGIVGLSYYCLTTGRQIEINADETFFAASTIKLPTHMMIAELVQAGSLSWYEYLTFTPEYFMDGSGVLQYDIRSGDTFTVAELMRYSIVYSDNIAHRLLLNTFSQRYELTESLFERYLPGESILGRSIITPNQLTEVFKILYRGRGYVAGYRQILEYMMNTSWTDRFATAMVDGYVAHTPGWTFPYSHDSGIFFTRYPYILVIMTSGVPSASDFLSDVSDIVFELHYEFQ